jgi:aminoglycoside phosphotransferase (APT) family kinase protein
MESSMPQPPERDIEKTRADLEAWLATKLETADAVALRSLGGPENTGFSSDTLMFDASWAADGRTVERPIVVRMTPSGFPIFPSYDITIQYRCMDKLRAVGVPVPEMLWLEQDDAILGSPFYVMERLQGRIPPDRPPYHMEGWLLDATPEQRRRVWMSGLEAMAAVHKCDWRALGFDFLDQPERGATGMEQHLHYYREFLDWALDGHTHPLFERAYDWLCANRPSGEAVRLIWGDARIGNQIFDDDGCIAVIDWEMATLGNPVQDLAWFMYLDRHHCDGIGVPRLDGLPDTDETIARWEELTGLDARGTAAYYELWSAFCFSVIMIRCGNQFRHYGLIDADSDFHVNNTATGLMQRVLAERGA